jgi:hypothetical protein
VNLDVDLDVDVNVDRNLNRNRNGLLLGLVDEARQRSDDAFEEVDPAIVRSSVIVVSSRITSSELARRLRSA